MNRRVYLDLFINVLVKLSVGYGIQKVGDVNFKNGTIYRTIGDPISDKWFETTIREKYVEIERILKQKLNHKQYL